MNSNIYKIIRQGDICLNCEKTKYVSNLCVLLESRYQFVNVFQKLSLSDTI